MNKLLLLLITFFLTACTSNSDSITQNEWKYSEGYSIGDWLTFEEPGKYKISYDTIFKQDTAIAIVLEVKEQSGGDTELILASIETGESGTYHQK